MLNWFARGPVYGTYLRAMTRDLNASSAGTPTRFPALDNPRAPNTLVGNVSRL